MKITKYRAIQPLYGMEFQRFYKKVKYLKLTYFLLKKTKYKAIQPLHVMEQQKFNKKETLAQAWIAHTVTLI